MYTTTNEFLDQVKARYQLQSDYALAGKLGLTRSMVSGYRHGKSKLGEEAAIRVAELLDLNPGYVLACMEAERSHAPSIREAWENLAELVKRHGATAAVMLLAVAPALTQTSGARAVDAVVCILCKLRALVGSWRNNRGDAVAITA